MAEQRLWQLIGAAVNRGVTGAWANVRDDVTGIANAAADKASGGILGDVGTATSILDDVVGVLNHLIGDIPLFGGILSDVASHFESDINPLKVLGNRGGKFGRGIGFGYAFGYALWQLSQPLVLEAQHLVNQAVQSSLLDPQTLADLVVRGMYDKNDAMSDAHGNNLNVGNFDRLINLAENRPELATVLDLWRRREIKADDVHKVLRENGIPEFWVGALMTLQRQLVSPADLALNVLRGEMTEKEGERYAEQLGVFPDDFNLLIQNTGEPPGPEQLMEALRRKFIDRERFDRGIRQSRVRNEWIDVEYALRQSPMSTADALRAVIESYITSEEGKHIAEQNGLIPEHWPILEKAWGRPLAHEQMADLVFRGEASRAQFDQAMRESDIKNKYIDLSFEIAYRLLTPFEIVRAIQYNAIDLKTAAVLILKQGFDKEAVKVILKTGLHRQSTAGHELTRTEIVSLYDDGGFTKAEALKQLEAIGYDAHTAGYVLEVADLKAHAAELKGELRVIRDNFLSGAINETTADAEQKQLGLTATQATVNIATWKREKKRASKGLSESQIVKAAKGGVLPYTEAIKLLTSIGYSSTDAVTLLLSNGVTAK